MDGRLVPAENRGMLPTGRLIKAARILLGWSQAQLAAKAGVGRNSLSRLEVEEVDPRSSTIRKLTEALEEGGIRFMHASDDDEGGVLLRRQRPQSEPP